MKNSMHVVFIVYNANTRGAVFNTTRHQAEYLVESGDRVTLLSNSCPDDWKGVFCVEIEEIGPIPIRLFDQACVGVTRRMPDRLKQYFNMNRVLPQLFFPLGAARRIAKIHQEHPVDCCVCCQHTMSFGLRRLSLATGIPFVLVSHGDIFEHPPGAFSIPMVTLYKKAAMLSYRTADCVIAVSKQIRARAIACGAHPDSVCVIPNGINMSEISMNGNGVAERYSEHEILFVGRLALEKAPDVLLRALALLPDIQFRLRIAGDGPMRKYLESLAAELQIAKRCKFLGNVIRKELASYYLSSDVVVLPSLTDAQPVVSLEAQLCGCPIVASDVGGIPDVVEDGKNGLLVPPGNVVALSEAIRRICLDEKLRQKMSHESIITAERFDWLSLLRRFRNTLSNTIEERRVERIWSQM